ncbi:hypothetical protein PV327_000602 [Microctonus hyperodae]|uniref:Uncharacterized protein n=1 Tax=Microctonus hyperodae TaxID=165561 RepID=A0AA39G7N4_MICHY|nr:hypothetical protein PV327_000602 [Microctonus hyperodae]
MTNTFKMSKVALFSIVGLLFVTNILAGSPDSPHVCGRHGDPCAIGCCEKFTCNRVAEKCMASITVSLLEEARMKLMRSKPPITRLASGKVMQCGVHDDPCSEGCCEGFTCNRVTKKCMASISVDMLRNAQLKLQQEQIKKEGRVFRRSVHKSDRCGKHGDSCSEGCCSGFTCNPAAGRCMATITADMLNEARSKLKHVEPRISGGEVAKHQTNSRHGQCGTHGAPCSEGCCDGYSCNSAAGKCMAIITGEMLKEARGKLKPVKSRFENNSPNSRAIGA